MKLLIIAASAATVGFGLFGQGAVNPAIKTHVSTLQNAKTLTATFSLTRVPAAPVDATLVYSKPNFYKIETADKLIVCDGKMLRELNKKDNTYTEVDASTAGSAEDEVATWAAFFNPDQFKEAKSITTGARRMLKGVSTQEYIVTLANNKTISLYIDGKSGIARGGSVKKGDSEILAVAREVTVDAPVAEGTFAWAPPAGAKKAEKPKPTAEVHYAEIDAIFSASCKGCHGTSGGIDLGSYSSTMAGKRGNPIVISGEPDKSSLYRAVRSGSMPKMGMRLSKDELKKIENWILGGAKE